MIVKSRINLEEFLKKLLKNGKVLLLMIVLSSLIALFVFFPFFPPASRPINPELGTRRTWEDGAEFLATSEFGIALILSPINLEESRSFNFEALVRAPIIHNNSFYDHDHQSYNLETPLNFFDIEDLDDFTNYSGSAYYECQGNPNHFPFDKYGFTFKFFNLDKINITQSNQIYVSLTDSESSWIVSEFGVIPHFDNTENALIIKFVIDRTREIRSSELFISIAILIGIVLVTMFNNPIQTPDGLDAILVPINKSSKFQKEQSKDQTSFQQTEEDPKQKIERNRDFRIRTAQWLLAFTVANILLSTSNLLDYNIKTSFSMFTTIFVGLYYLFSKNQGKELGAQFCLFIGVVSLLSATLAILFVFLI